MLLVNHLSDLPPKFFACIASQTRYDGGMNWPQLLAELRKRGWTQTLLAERLGIAQSAISELGSGVIKDPRYATGAALWALHASGDVPVAAEAKAA